MRSPGTRLRCFGTAQSNGKWRNISHASRRKNSQTTACKHSKNSKNTIRKMASALQRISARLNIPTCPYISLPGFKKTELANILQFLSASSVLAFLLCCLFSWHLFLVVSWLGICVEVTVDQTTSSLFFFFVCLVNARDTQMTTRVSEGALVSRVFAARRSRTPLQSTVNRPGDRLTFANLTSFLWSIRVQTMENCCRFVQ